MSSMSLLRHLHLLQCPHQGPAFSSSVSGALFLDVSSGTAVTGLPILPRGGLPFSLKLQDFPAENSLVLHSIYTPGLSNSSWKTGDQHYWLSWLEIATQPGSLSIQGLFPPALVFQLLPTTRQHVLAIGKLPCVNAGHELCVRQLYRFILTYLVRSPRPSHGWRNLYI